MIEMAMFFGLGFFVACLVMIFVANAVWRRAVRLTTKRVQAALPVSLAEIKADRDQLRAEFAMSTRRLEVSVDELKKKSQAQLVDIARKNEQLRLLLSEVKDRTDKARELQEREGSLRDELLKAEASHGDVTRRLREAETKLSESTKLLADRERALTESQTIADSRRIEIAALQTNVARFQDDVSDLKRALTSSEDEKTQRQARLGATEIALAEARARITALESELGAAEQAARSQAEEVGRLSSRIVEQSGQLTGQIGEAERMASRIQEISGERDQLHEAMVRRVAEAEVRATSLVEELENHRRDKDTLRTQLDAERTEREKAVADLKRLESAAQENWERERVENALLRERINDLAAEITTMTSALEGPESAVEKLISKAESEARAGAVMPSTATLGPGGVIVTKPDDPRRLTLAERVRALQARAKFEN